jgi:hypothetical protein
MQDAAHRDTRFRMPRPPHQYCDTMHRRTAALLQCAHVAVLAVLVVAVVLTVMAVPDGAPRYLAPVLMGAYIVVMCGVGVSGVLVMHRRSIRRLDDVD